jgi:hypothetical protein
MPTLFDRLLAATYHPNQINNPNPTNKTGAKQQAMKIRSALLSARRYDLDDDTVQAAAILGVQHPDILLAMLPRARATFPKVAFQWRQGAALEALGIEPETPDKMTCAYIEQINDPTDYPNYRLSTMSFLDDDRTVAVDSTAIVFSLDQPIIERLPYLHQERSSLARLTGKSKEMLDRCLLGSTYSVVDEDHSKWLTPLTEITDTNVIYRKQMADHRLNLCRNLASYASHTFSPFHPDYDVILGFPTAIMHNCATVMGINIIEFAGTWRFVITVLAMLQARKYLDHGTPASDGKRRFVGNKEVPYLQYHRVSLKVPRQIVVREMIESVRESIPQPRREIEGYWRERRTKAGPKCDHIDVSETPNRSRCIYCKRARYWTANYMRGSAEVGFVTKERVVQMHGGRVKG